MIELNDSLSKNYCISRDIVDAKESIKVTLNGLERRQSKLGLAWRDFERNLVDLKKLSVLEEGVQFVTSWILGTGELLINGQQTIGTDLQSCEELRCAHEILEMQCCETYGFYAELIYKIDSFSSLNETSAHKDLLAQKQFMDFVCRSFASRLERRKYLLITCLRFYRLVEQYFDKTSSTFDSLITGNKMLDDFETCENNLQKLQDASKNLGKRRLRIATHSNKFDGFSFYCRENVERVGERGREIE